MVLLGVLYTGQLSTIEKTIEYTLKNIINNNNKVHIYALLENNTNNSNIYYEELLKNNFKDNLKSLEWLNNNDL